VIQAAVRVLEIARPGLVRLLLETTSGQAGDLGQRFEELAEMVRGIEAAKPAAVGICLDTAHVFAAGYDLATPKGLDRTLMDFDRLIGLDRLAFLHLNDSRFGLGEKKDRHEALGRGRIGSKALARFIRRPELNHLCAVMETPRQSDEDDRLNMARARSWAGRPEP
jgi:deoxyribonuclease-4